MGSRVRMLVRFMLLLREWRTTVGSKEILCQLASLSRVTVRTLAFPLVFHLTLTGDNIEITGRVRGVGLSGGKIMRPEQGQPLTTSDFSPVTLFLLQFTTSRKN